MHPVSISRLILSLSLASSSMAFAQSAETNAEEIKKLKTVVSVLLAEIKTLKGCDGTLSPDKKSCYKYVATPQTYVNAEHSCAAWGGKVSSVANKEEQNFLISLSGPSGIWLGGNRTSAGWVWSDGTPWKFESWKAGEPNNAGGGESCNYQGFHSPELWADFPCDFAIPFICKKAAKF